jgi:hypothetical protein
MGYCAISYISRAACPDIVVATALFPPGERSVSSVHAPFFVVQASRAARDRWHALSVRLLTHALQVMQEQFHAGPRCGVELVPDGCVGPVPIECLEHRADGLFTIGQLKPAPDVNRAEVAQLPALQTLAQLGNPGRQRVVG